MTQFIYGLAKRVLTRGFILSNVQYSLEHILVQIYLFSQPKPRKIFNDIKWQHLPFLL